MQSLNINMFSCFLFCLHVSLYVSNHFNHCIKLFAPCGTLIGNAKFLFLILLILMQKKVTDDKRDKFLKYFSISIWKIYCHDDEYLKCVENFILHLDEQVPFSTCNPDGCQGIFVSQSESRGSGRQYGNSEEFTSTKMTKFMLQTYKICYNIGYICLSR